MHMKSHSCVLFTSATDPYDCWPHVVMRAGEKGLEWRGPCSRKLRPITFEYKNLTHHCERVCLLHGMPYSLKAWRSTGRFLANASEWCTPGCIVLKKMFCKLESRPLTRACSCSDKPEDETVINMWIGTVNYRLNSSTDWVSSNLSSRIPEQCRIRTAGSTTRKSARLREHCVKSIVSIWPSLLVNSAL